MRRKAAKPTFKPYTQAQPSLIPPSWDELIPANRLYRVGEVDYTWDDNGNLLSDEVYTYSYDHANRLVGVSGAGLAANYAYNGLGDRLRQTANSVTTEYVLDLAAGLTQVLSDETNAYLYGAGGSAKSSRTAGSTTWEMPWAACASSRTRPERSPWRNPTCRMEKRSVARVAQPAHTDIPGNRWMSTRISCSCGQGGICRHLEDS